MRKFRSPAAFAEYLRGVAQAIPAAEDRGLRAAAELIAEEARQEIGHYQDAAGPFEAWAPLAERTQAERAAAGFPPDYPLLRSGELRHSIGYDVEGRTAVIGSPLEIALWQEMGTANARNPIPPRPFLGPAAVRKGEEAAKAIGEAVAGKLPSEQL